MAQPHLTDLFISKVRVKILHVFLTNPDEIYYVRQLVRKTNEEINAVRRELAHMESGGMVSKEARGNRLYYWFKKDYLYYDELAAMVTKSYGIGNEIITKRNKLGKIQFVMFSKDFSLNLTKEDDNQIDILFVGDVVLPEITVLIQTEEAKRKREINYTVMTSSELEIRKSGRDPFLLEIFSQPRLMIIGDEKKLIT